VRIGVLNNLRAGRSGTQVSRILELLRSHPDVLHVETDHAHVLPEALAELTHAELDLLVLNGGDGTLQFALTEMLSDPDLPRVPMVAPLRGGRTNMTALDMRAQRDPVKGLARLLHAIDTGRLEEHLVSRSVVRVASSRREKVEYGMFFGAGIIRRAISVVHRVFPTGRSQGVFGAGIVTAALIGKLFSRPTDGIMTPDKVGVLLDDGNAYSGEFYLLIASTLDRLFLRMNPYWGHGSGGVRFTSLASNAQRIAAAVPGILRGRPARHVTPENGYTSVNSERVDLRFDCGFTIDGEIFDPQPDERVTLGADRRITFVRA
jgi:hypothetical protein